MPSSFISLLTVARQLGDGLAEISVCRSSPPRRAGASLSGERQLDLPLVFPDLLHPDVDRIAEPEGPTTAPPDEPGLERVDLVVVAGEPSSRQVTLENVAEADEEAGADHPRDLAGERLLPAALEEDVLEQPRGNDVVCAVLDLARLAFLGKRLVRRAELSEQPPVHDEIGVASDRRREVAVRGAREPRVAEV